MQKVIIWTRVSTDKQEFESQKKDLIELAKQDHFSQEQMIFIEYKNSSARSINQIYKQQIQELKDKIEEYKGQIKALYVWEISRLGRHENIILDLKKYLLDRKINLIVKTPSLRLLNEDGTINYGVELAFSMFATLAKQEMELTFRRMKRGKIMAGKQGRVIGSSLLWGYKKNVGNYIEIDEKEADNVRFMFKTYLKEGETCRTVGLKLHNRGAKGFDRTDGEFLQNKIAKHLKKTEYFGKSKNMQVYPPIISEEIFNKVREKLKAQNTKLKNCTKHEYLCRGKLKDKDGNMFTPNWSTACFVTRMIKGKKKYLNLNVYESIMLQETLFWYQYYLLKKMEQDSEYFEKLIEQNKKTIEIKKLDLSNLDKKMDRLNFMYLKLTITQEQYQEGIDDIKNEYDKIEKEISDLQIKNSDLASEIENVPENFDKKYIDKQVRKLNKASLKEKVEMTKKVINYIEVEHTGKKAHQYIKVYNLVDPKTVNQYETETIKGNQLKLYEIDENKKRVEDISDLIFIRTTQKIRKSTKK